MINISVLYIARGMLGKQGQIPSFFFINFLEYRIMKTYRVFYVESQEKFIDIPAQNKDEALQHFDCNMFDKSRVTRVSKTSPKITTVQELQFDIFAEIDAVTDHYLKPGGTD